MLEFIFLSLVGIHGLIHLLGFAKAFELAEIKQLTQPISRSQGTLWLLAAVLFFAVIPVYLLGPEWWWAVALAAVIVSQALIFFDWQDARFGTVANAIVVFSLFAVFGWNRPAELDAVPKHDIARYSAATEGGTRER